ncbi:MAG: GNAT family N-acetyltransferase [Symbiobacteriia bacterium]
MRFTIVPMNDAYARTVAGWHYEGVYGFYDLKQDPEDLAELLDPKSWEDTYVAALDEGRELVGFFGFESRGDMVTLGVGLRPDLTGRGLGLSFLEAGLQYARDRYHPKTFRLVVAAFNQRAIRLYERAGFARLRVFANYTNGGEHEFLEMSRPA